VAVDIPFLWRAEFLFTVIKAEGAFENIKTTSDSSPVTELSNNITFSQSQSHATAL
jgi:hypothetical protein